MSLAKFQTVYSQLNASNLELLDELYADNIRFIDPFHQVDGRDNLKIYFQRLYQNVESIQFEFGDSICQGDSCFINWVMRLEHPKLNAGRQVSVEGGTQFKVDTSGKIISHRDYFDAGAMLYEQLPLIGRLIKLVKSKL